jgi:Ca2+:H+ antiporter
MGLARRLSREYALWAALISVIAAFSMGAGFTIDKNLIDNFADPWPIFFLFAWLFLVILWAASSVVNHAEVLAHKYGEPYGTLILTFSVVTIEVIMIVAIMLHEDNNPTFARDTLYTLLILMLNVMIGLPILVGGLKHGEQRYNLKSSETYYSVILCFVGLGLFMPVVMPAYYLETYEIFLIAASVALYLVFLRIQTREHRYFFVFEPDDKVDEHDENIHSESGIYHICVLIAILLLVAFLSKSLAIVTDKLMADLKAPEALGALVVAILILAPEALTALRAGLNNEAQRVVNIGLGSALSTIGLTIPVVLVIGFLTGRTVDLALSPIQMMMLGLTLLVGIVSYRRGETNVLMGAIHMVLFAAFAVLTFM